MEDISSFGPSGVVIVGLGDAEIEQLQEECSARRYRLVVAARTSDLPLSLQCDYAIVNTLLPDGDGRKLATDFVRAGARVLLVDNVGSVPLFDAWRLGASTASPSGGPADWLDELSRSEQVEAVSRAGRLMEPLRLADAVASAAAFSGSSGVPVCFVRIQPRDDSRAAMDDALDRLTSVVGITTVFYDVPSGERIALVVNGDRRRLAKLLDNPQLKSEALITVVEVAPEDDLAALVGRSLILTDESGTSEERTKVLVAFATGHEKSTETLRMGLHKLDFSPVFWDAAFKFEETRSNLPAAVVIDVRQEPGVVAKLIEQAHAQKPPVPVLAVSDDENIEQLQSAMQAGASDFLTWPFEPGDVQAALARVTVVAAAELEARATASAETIEEAGPDETPAAPQEAEDSLPAPKTLESAAPSESATLPPVPDETIDAADASPVAETTQANSSPVPPDDPGHEGIFVQVLAEQLASGRSIALKGLGALKIRHETSRIVHDREGRTIVEPPRRTISFVQESPQEEDIED